MTSIEVFHESKDHQDETMFYGDFLPMAGMINRNGCSFFHNMLKLKRRRNEETDPNLQQEKEEEEESEQSSSPSSKRICTEYVRRFPCRARSLSHQHNSKTAFFEIPQNAPHGLLLKCSHEECNKSNRRFRYCNVCKLPVAKRNFIKRHGHGLVHSSRQLKETVDRFHSEARHIDLEKDAEEEASESSISNTSFHPKSGVMEIPSLAIEELEDDGTGLQNIRNPETIRTITFQASPDPLLNKGYYPIPSYPQEIMLGTQMACNPIATGPSLFGSCKVISSDYEPFQYPFDSSNDVELPHFVPFSPDIKTLLFDVTGLNEETDPDGDMNPVPFTEAEKYNLEENLAEIVGGIDFSRVFE